MAAFAPRRDPSHDAWSYSFVLQDTALGWGFALTLLEQGVALYWHPQRFPNRDIPLVTLLARVHPTLGKKTFGRMCQRSEVCKQLPERTVETINPDHAKAISPNDCQFFATTLATAVDIAACWQTIDQHADRHVTQWIRVACQPEVPGAVLLKQGAVVYLPQNPTNRHALNQRLKRRGLTSATTQLSPGYYATHCHHGHEVQNAVQTTATGPETRWASRQTGATAGAPRHQPARAAHSTT